MSAAAWHAAILAKTVEFGWMLALERQSAESYQYRRLVISKMRTHTWKLRHPWSGPGTQDLLDKIIKIDFVPTEY